MEDESEHDLGRVDDPGSSRGFMNIKIKTDIVMIWVIIFLNLLISWIAYFGLLGLNLTTLNDRKKKNSVVSFTKAIVLAQGVLCLLAGIFLFSMSKKVKFAIIPLVIFFLTVAVLSFILASRLGSVNKEASRGELREETLARARSFAIVLAAGYTGAVTLMIAYVWFFKPDMYNYVYYKLTSALRTKSVDENEMDYEGEGYGDYEDQVDAEDRAVLEEGSVRASAPSRGSAPSQSSSEAKLKGGAVKRKSRGGAVQDDYSRRQEAFESGRRLGASQNSKRSGGSNPPSYRSRPSKVVTGFESEDSLPSAEDFGGHLLDLASGAGAAAAAAYQGAKAAGGDESTGQGSLGSKVAVKVAQAKAALAPSDEMAAANLAKAQIRANASNEKEKNEMVSTIASYK